MWRSLNMEEGNKADGMSCEDQLKTLAWLHWRTGGWGANLAALLLQPPDGGSGEGGAGLLCLDPVIRWAGLAQSCVREGSNWLFLYWGHGQTLEEVSYGSGQRPKPVKCFKTYLASALNNIPRFGQPWSHQATWVDDCHRPLLSKLSCSILNHRILTLTFPILDVHLTTIQDNH